MIETQGNVVDSSLNTLKSLPMDDEKFGRKS